MSEMSFDAKSEREMAALEAGPVGDLLRSTGGAIYPPAELAARLEGRLRAMGAEGAAPVTGAGKAGARTGDGRSRLYTGNAQPDSSRLGLRVPRLAWVGLGLAAMVVLAFGLAGLFGAKVGERAAGTASDFVPQGKVRHIVFEDRYAQSTITNTQFTDSYSSTQGVWLANGAEHLIMFALGPSPGCCERHWRLVDDDAVWFYVRPRSTLTTTNPTNRSFMSNVLKTAYDPRHFDGIVPDKALLDNFLKMPGYSLAGAERIDGRDTIVVQSAGLARSIEMRAVNGVRGIAVVGFELWPELGAIFTSMSGLATNDQAFDSLTGHPLSTPTAASGPGPGVPSLEITPPRRSDTYRNEVDYRIWFDKETYRVLQVQVTTTSYGGLSDGMVTRNMRSIMLDELLDASAVPADMFKPDVQEGEEVQEAYSALVRQAMPYADATPVTPVIVELAVPGSVAAGEPKVGDLAPDFEVADVMTGKPVRLSSLRGKLVVLNFWGMGCTPCTSSMPIMQEVHDTLKDKVAFVSITSGPRYDAAKVKQFVTGNGYTWTFLDEGGEQVVFNAYRAGSIPTFCFIDATGVIKAIHRGAMVAGAIPGENTLKYYLNQVDPNITLMNPLGVPAPNNPGWYVFTSPSGSYSVLMPQELVEPSGRDGWDFYGVREGEALTYISGFKEYGQILASGDANDHLEMILPEVETFMNGTARPNPAKIALGAHPGFELMLDRADGRFMRARVYSIGSRAYIVYAIAQEEQALFTAEMDSYLDSLTLLR
jgi:peroxiredoxin